MLPSLHRGIAIVLALACAALHRASPARADAYPVRCVDVIVALAAGTNRLRVRVAA